jgi:FkbM family methyltransferase
MGHLDRIKKGEGKFSNVWGRIQVFKNWYKLVFPFNRVFTGVQKVKLRNGKSAYVRGVRSMDLNIVRDVLGSEEYQLDYITLPDNAVVIDLGGNIGTFSMEIHRQFPTAQLIAYEPFPSNVEMFKLNAPFATVIQKAAGAKTGTVRFESGNNFVGLRVIKQGGIEVASVSLDEITKDFERVDLLKIDIEGSEYDVLNAASSQTFNKIQHIIMETHDMPGFDDLAWAENILRKNGFKTRWIDPSGIIYGEKS